MAYVVTRFPALSPHWGVHDRIANRWAPVSTAEAATQKICDRLNAGKEVKGLMWRELSPQVYGEPDAYAQALGASP